jgi:hypothetical protein
VFQVSDRDSLRRPAWPKERAVGIHIRVGHLELFLLDIAIGRE